MRRSTIRRFPEPRWHWKLRRIRHRARRWLWRWPRDTSFQARVYRAALLRHHGSCPPASSMAGVHLSHDGRKYFSIQQRDEADKAHAKSTSKGNGDRGRTANSRGGAPVGSGGNSAGTAPTWTDAEWQAWMAKWPTPAPWHKKVDDSAAAPGRPADEGAIRAIKERFPDGRFSCENT